MKIFLLFSLTFFFKISICQIANLNNIQWIQNIGGIGFNSLIIKTNSSNEIYCCTTYDACSSCQLTISDNIVPVNNNEIKRIILIRLSPQGGLVSIDSILNPTSDILFSGFQIDSKDNLLFYFYTGSSFIFNGQTISEGYNILKLDNNLNYIWSQNIRGSTHNIGNIADKQFTIDSDDNVFVGGCINLLYDTTHIIDTMIFYPDTFFVYESYYDTLKIANQIYTVDAHNIFITKFNSFGNHQWTKILKDTIGFVSLTSLTTDYNGNSFLYGYFQEGNWIINQDTLYHFSTSNIYAYNGYLIKIDPLGNILWSKSIFDNIQTESIKCDLNNNIIISGSFWGSSNYQNFHVYACSSTSDYIISKFSENGDIIWAKRFGSTYTDQNGFLSIDFINCIYLTGYDGSTSILSKFNSSGNYIEGLEPYSSSGNLYGLYSTHDNNMDILITGYYNGPANFGQYSLNSTFGVWHQYILKTGIITEINNIINQKEDIWLYPTPAKTELNYINFTNNRIQEIQVYDISKRLVTNMCKLLKNGIDVHNLSSGIYFLKFNLSGKTISKKFIKI